MNSSPVNTLIEFGSLALLASLITFPVLGFTGFFAVLFLLYMGLALVNGAGKAEQRYNNRAAKKRRG